MANMNINGETARNLDKGQKVRNHIKQINSIFDIFSNVDKSALVMAERERFKSKPTPPIGTKSISKLQDFFVLDAMHSKSLLRPRNQRKGSQLQETVLRNLQSPLVERTPNNPINIKRMLEHITGLEQVLKQGESFTVFDVETIGGVNEYGTQTLDRMLSYTFQEMNKEGVIQTHESLIGFDKDIASKYETKLTEIFQKPRSMRTSYENVLVDQLSIIGHEQTQIEEHIEGMFRISKAPEVVVGTKERAIAGLEILSSTVYEKQKDNLAWQQNLKDIVENMNKEEHIYMAYNSMFDINVINQTLGMNESFNGLYISPNAASQVVDPFLINKAIAKKSGISSLYNKQGIMNPRLGGLQLESLARFHVPQVYSQGAAHISSVDTYATGSMFTEKVNLEGYDSFIDFYKDKLAYYNSDTAEVNAKQIYFMEKTALPSGRQPMSFTYNPISDSYNTTSGFDIKDNRVTSKGYSSTPYKRGAMYNIQHEQVSMDIVDKILRDNPEYRESLGDLSGPKHLVIMTPIDPLDKTGLVAQRQSFVLFDTLQEVEELYGSASLVGEWSGKKKRTFKNINDMSNYKIAKEMGQIDISKITANHIIDKSATLEDLIDISHRRLMNDTAARNVRDIRYTNYLQRRSKYETLNKIGTPEAIADMIFKDDTDRIFRNKDVIDAFTINVAGKKKFIPETLMNTIASQEYFNSMQDVYQAVYEEVTNVTKSLPKSKATDLKRDLLFKEGVEKVMSGLALNTKEIKVPTSSINKLQINVGGILQGLVSENNILDINLDYGANILTKAYNMTGQVGAIETAGGYNVLRQLKQIERLPGYKDVFKDIDLQAYASQGRSAKIVADEMTKRLRARVKETRLSNPLFGRLNMKDNYFDVLSSAGKINKKEIHDLITGSLDDMAKLDVLNVTESAGLTERLSKHFDMINYKNFEESINFLPQEQQEYLRANAKKAKAELRNIYSDFAKAVKDANITVALDKDMPGEVFLIDSAGRKTSLALPGLTSYNNSLSIKLGDNDYVLSNYIDALKYKTSSALGDIGIETNIAAGTRGTMSYRRAVEKAIEKGESPIRAITQTTSRKSVGIMEKSILIERYNPKMIRSQFELNTNSILQVLPELLEDDVFMTQLYKNAVTNESNIKGVVTDIKTFKKDMKKFVDSQLRRDAGDIDRIDDFLKMGSTARTSLATNMKYVMSTLAEFKEYDAQAKRILSNITINTRDKRITKGAFPIFDPRLDALGGLNNQDKTTPFQHDNRIMRARDSYAFLEEHLNVKIDPVITDMIEQNFLTDVKDPTGLRSASGLIMDIGSLDQTSYNKLINKNKAVFLKQANELYTANNYLGEMDGYTSKNIYHNILELMENVNLHEQAGAINPTLYDLAYENQQFKTLIRDRESALIATGIKQKALDYEFSNGKFTYGIGFMSETNDIALSIAHGENIPDEIKRRGFSSRQAAYVTGLEKGYSFDIEGYTPSNSDAFIQGRFINKQGRIVESSEIEKLLQNTNLTSKTEIESYLRKKGITYDIITSYAQIPEASKFFFASSEKGTYTSMIPGVGTIDPRINKALETIGLEDIAGKKLRIGALEAKLTQAQSRGVSKEVIEGVKKAIMKERYVGASLFEQVLDNKVNMLFQPGLGGHAHAGASFSMLMESYAKQSKVYKEKGFTSNFLTEVFGSNYKEKLKLAKDGKQIIPINTELRASDLQPNIQGLKKIFEKEKLKLTESLLEDNMGRVFVAPIVNVYDDIAGGFSNQQAQRKNISHYDSQIDALKREILDINADDSIDPRKRKEMILDANKEIKTLSFKREAAVTSMNSQKGMKITDISLSSLNREKWSQEKLDLLNKRLSMTEKMDLAKHSDKLIYSNGNLTMMDKAKGVAIYENLTETFRRILKEGQGEEQLKDLLNDEGARLRALFPGKNFTKEYASNLESFSLGSHALMFNQVKGEQDIKQLMKKGFIKRDLIDADLEIGGIGKALNLFEDNLYKTSNVFDLGEQFGADRYLAIERSIFKQYGERYIKPPHIEELGTLQKLLINIEDAVGTERDTLIARARGVKKDIIRKQSSYISGKGSTMSESLFNLRLDMSFRGKGSGMYLAPGETNELVKRALVKGETIANRRAKGFYDDASWISEQAFKQMGYFEPEKMEKILGEGATKEQMIEHLQTKGALMLSTRQPEIREGSIVPQRVYMSKMLGFNEVKVLDITAKAANLDHDGDQMAFASLEYNLDKQKFYYDEYLRDASNMPTKAKAYFADIEAGMSYRSAVVNKAYFASTQEALSEELGLSKNTFDEIFEIASNETIGDVLYSSQYGISKNIWEIEKDFKAIKPYMHESMNIKDTAKYIASTVEDTTKRTELFNSLAAAYNYQKYTMEARAKSFSANIGEASIINRNLSELYESFITHGSDVETKQADIFKAVIYRAEEAAIGAKKISDIASDQASIERATAIDVVEKWTENIKAIYANPNNTEASSNIKEWILDRTSKPLSKIEHQEYFSARNIKNTSAEEMADTFINVMRQLSAKQKNAPGMAVNIIGTRGGIGSTGEHLVRGVSLAQESFSQDAMREATEANLLEHKIKEPTISMRERIFEGGTQSIPSEEFDLRSEARSASSTIGRVRKAGVKMGDSFANFLRESSGSKLTKAALGVAGALIGAGILSGSPLEVDNPEADEIAVDYSSLLDDPLVQQTQYFNPGEVQGYTINIKANSDKRSESYLMTQVNEAIQKQFNGGVNVNMNINNTYTIPNQRDILNNYGQL